VRGGIYSRLQLEMSLLTELGIVSADFYKDVAPTALISTENAREKKAA
jgi:hypothetical protein